MLKHSSYGNKPGERGDILTGVELLNSVSLRLLDQSILHTVMNGPQQQAIKGFSAAAVSIPESSTTIPFLSSPFFSFMIFLLNKQFLPYVKMPRTEFDSFLIAFIRNLFKFRGNGQSVSI